MKRHQIAVPEKEGTSWPSLITSIKEVGENKGKAFPRERIAQLRSVISSAVKGKFPNRTYKAKHQVKGGDIVTWIWLDEIISN